MKFLLAEDVAIEVARCLQQAGHEVMLIAEALGMRTDDVEVWGHATRIGAIVVTCNRTDHSEPAEYTAGGMQSRAAAAGQCRRRRADGKHQFRMTDWRAALP